MLAGMFYILISAASFGALAIFVRIAYANGIDTPTLLFMRFSIAAICLGAVMVARRTPLPRGRDLTIVMLMGAVGYAGQSFCYLSALHYASAGLVALLLYLYPVIVTVLAAAFLHETITRTKLLALVFGLAGSALTIGPAADAKPMGILLGIGAALIYAIYITVGSRVLTRVSPLQLATMVSVSASAVFGVVMLVNGAAFPGNATGWLATIAIALISTVVAILAFFAGLERVGPVNASTLSTAEPIVTLVLAWLFLGEGITLLRMTGGAMILLAVILLARQGMRRSAPVAAFPADVMRDRS